MVSHDIEDILNLFDGRETLVADQDIRSYIATQIKALLSHSDFDYTVQSLVRGNSDRAKLLFERLERAKLM